ncbi:O-methyltransferase-domain-containing protein [Phyllosticta capitalensis]|uniref:O-methyltransferase-domain-containing protein n=2 Tax=Phyllosticta capitalensis TaxID=121624 RepID=A0ABR1YJ49_9PEZI
MSFTALAEQLLEEAKKLDSHVAAGRDVSNLATTAGAPDHKNFVVQFKESRERAINTANEFLRQAYGPRDYVREKLSSGTDNISFQALYRYDIPPKVNEKTGTTFTDLAKQAGVPEEPLARILRNAVTLGIFEEPSPGVLAHNAISRSLLDPYWLSFMGFVAQDLVKFHTRALDAIEKWPAVSEPTECGFSLAYQSKDPLFLHFEKNPEIAMRAGKAFRAVHNTTDDGSIWQEIDRPGAVMVDVGGGHGHIAMAIARATRHLKCVVEDLPGTVEITKKEIPPELEGRVQCQAQDFFTEQQWKGADVYFFSKIMHDWSDAYCIKILRNLIPAMKEGSTVVVNEWLVPEQARAENAQRFIRLADLTMLSAHNGKERTKGDWRKLFKEADERFGAVEFVEWPWTNFVHILSVWKP